MNSIFHRRSIRKFTDQPVEKEKIELMLRAAMAAPSACNQQPWEYYVITGEENVQRLCACSPYAKFAVNAPVMFCACYRKGCRIPIYAQIDLSASVENLLLEADELGLGATWIGIAPQEERMTAVEKALDMPDTLRPFALIACGYPAETKEPADRYEEKRVHWVGT